MITSKPFIARELLARIRSLLRRVQLDSERKSKPLLLSGDLKLDSLRHRVLLGGLKIDLTAKEFELLYLLKKSPGKVFSGEVPLEDV